MHSGFSKEPTTRWGVVSSVIDMKTAAATVPLSTTYALGKPPRQPGHRRHCGTQHRGRSSDSIFSRFAASWTLLSAALRLSEGGSRFVDSTIGFRDSGIDLVCLTQPRRT